VSEGVYFFSFREGEGHSTIRVKNGGKVECYGQGAFVFRDFLVLGNWGLLIRLQGSEGKSFGRG